MREIKFRAWDGKKLHDGNRIILRNNLEVTTSITSFTLNDFFTALTKKGWEFSQYTGRKDEKENEIYEGDIVKDQHGIKYEIGYHTKLVWDGSGSEHPGFYIYNGDMDFHEGFDDFEVIGNIYENPNLLAPTEAQ